MFKNVNMFKSMASNDSLHVFRQMHMHVSAPPPPLPRPFPIHFRFFPSLLSFYMCLSLFISISHNAQ